MGKSFANFMCKKFFHPSSFANIKRVWLAEQRVAEETKKQEELRAEYERDQDHYNNRQLMGDERVKNGLTFIYEAPKAYQKESSDAPAGKLEWKRATPIQPAASEQGASGTRQGGCLTPAGQSQEGGATVRKVRCIRCQEMGHVPSDKECPMYDPSKEDGSGGGTVHQDQLVEEMRRDGLAFKQNVMGRSIEDHRYNQDLVGDDESGDGPPPEEAFLSSLTKKQKKKLLKKLHHLEKKHSGSVHKKKSCKKRRHDNNSESSSTDGEDAPRRKHRKESRKKERRADSNGRDSSSEGKHRTKQARRSKRSFLEDEYPRSKDKKTRRAESNDSSSSEESFDGRHQAKQAKQRGHYGRSPSSDKYKKEDSIAKEKGGQRSTKMLDSKNTQSERHDRHPHVKKEKRRDSSDEREAPQRDRNWERSRTLHANRDQDKQGKRSDNHSTRPVIKKEKSRRSSSSDDDDDDTRKSRRRQHDGTSSDSDHRGSTNSLKKRRNESNDNRKSTRRDDESRSRDLRKHSPSYDRGRDSRDGPRIKVEKQDDSNDLERSREWHRNGESSDRRYRD